MSSFPTPSKKFNGDDLPINPSQGRVDETKDPKAVLKKVIEKELEKGIPIKSWSKKVENDLIANVIVSFEKYFPKQSLCKTTLKNLFSKIKSSMDTKIDNEPFSLQSFLKNNLQITLPAKNTKEPYTLSFDLAEKLKTRWNEEKIAQLSIHELSAPIWSIQKHLLSDIKLNNLRAPFEVYGYEDQLILESIVSLLIDNPLIENSDLVNSVESIIKKVNILTLLNEEKKIKPLLYTLYANICSESGVYDLYFSKLEQQRLKAFFSHFTTLQSNSKQSLERGEWAERLLSLYLLGVYLPKNIPEKVLEIGIEESISQLRGEAAAKNTGNKNLVIFFNASLYLHCFFSKNTSYEKIKQFLMQCYTLTTNFAPFHQTTFDRLEFFVYSEMEKKHSILTSIDPISITYLKDILIKTQVENPYFSPESCLSKTIGICNQRLNLSAKITQKSFSQIKLKIHMWATSREMVMRQIHIAPEHPFTLAISKLWKKIVGHKLMRYMDHHSFIDHVLKSVLKDFPALSPFKNALKKNLSAYYMIFWYNMNFDSKASTLDRWLFWHHQNLNAKDHTGFKDIEQLCALFFPNIPHKECAARFKALISKVKA
ncbi:hypothetical protein COB21_01370 [Candidatus Aerophobetes bacterium]|uniref:Uncharacterized protein n=1 Tax=Aerophobetes bacterium TaxID=2030807 RepID=A0A2A4X7V7_UNCAE|nr:MAG: hypothetical protein COB21_01370 [Candidatus Aerophobetes bacterium]